MPKHVRTSTTMANDILELRRNIEENLNDDSKPWSPILKFSEETSGISRIYIFRGLIGFICLWLAFGYAGQLICNLIGIIYPIYSSIHAIESKTIDDDTKWLTYWVVFSIFSFFEYFAEIIVGWFFLYWLVKSIFFVWLMAPTNTNGSLTIYNNIIKPYFLQYHKVVDDAVLTVQETASHMIDSNKKK